MIALFKCFSIIFKLTQQITKFKVWRIKYQLVVTGCFISIVITSTCLRHSYIHHHEIGTILLNYHIDRDLLGSMCFGDLVWLVWNVIRVAGWSKSCAHRTKNNTTNVVIQQNSRKFLMMVILNSITSWIYKMWNKSTSDITFVFYSTTNTMLKGPINISVHNFLK